jgi:hypothetical protein
VAKPPLLALAFVVLALAAQDSKKAPPPVAKVDEARVNVAVKRGVDALLKLSSPPAHKEIPDSDELILWTLLHAGIDESLPRFQELLQKMLAAPLERTYKVALQAMVLEELDRVKYQRRIAQCGQFLLDNESKRGHWSYGEATPFVDSIPTPTPRKEPASSGGSRSKPKGGDPVSAVPRRVKPKVVASIVLKKRRDAPDEGDNSNSQYAALGLRACHDAGIVFPEEAIRLALKYWTEAQHLDPKSPAHGWCYTCGSRDESAHKAWAAISAGAVGALTIYHYILGEPWMKDAAVLSGLDWLAKNFSVTANTGRQDAKDPQGLRYLSYYLYALERAGTLYGTERLDAHEWYAEGAKMLLDTQAADGSWFFKSDIDNRVWDTCFAILFLRRATRPLSDVATVDRYIKK